MNEPSSLSRLFTNLSTFMSFDPGLAFQSSKFSDRPTSQSPAQMFGGGKSLTAIGWVSNNV